MDEWIAFFEPFFATRNATLAFVERLERLPLHDPSHRAKIMMHQTQRLVSIADDIPSIRKGKESLQLLFLLVCAENIAKMHENFHDEGQSRAYVRKFFDLFVVDADRTQLESSFSTYARVPLDMAAVANALYSVRCDVVHEGKYWGFHFHDGRKPMVNDDPDVIVSLTIAQFRSIVVRGCIRAIQTYVPAP